MEKKIILAIDDNIQQLKIFEMILTPKYDVRVVKSASTAMSFLNNNTVDIILLDLDMPNISGVEFLKDIRKIPSYIKVPIIIVSGTAKKDFLDKYKNSSAFEILSKPVVPEMLIETIEKALAS